MRENRLIVLIKLPLKNSIFFSIFSEADARKAMSKDRQNMQHRYIELFYDGTSSGGGSGGGRGFGGNDGPMMPAGGAAYSTGTGAFSGGSRNEGFGGGGNGYSTY